MSNVSTNIPNKIESEVVNKNWGGGAIMYCVCINSEQLYMEGSCLCLETGYFKYNNEISK